MCDDPRVQRPSVEKMRVRRPAIAGCAPARGGRIPSAGPELMHAHTTVVELLIQQELQDPGERDGAKAHMLGADGKSLGELHQSIVLCRLHQERLVERCRALTR